MKLRHFITSVYVEELESHNHIQDNMHIQRCEKIVRFHLKLVPRLNASHCLLAPAEPISKGIWFCLFCVCVILFFFLTPGPQENLYFFFFNLLALREISVKLIAEYE